MSAHTAYFIVAVYRSSIITIFHCAIVIPAHATGSTVAGDCAVVITACDCAFAISAHATDIVTGNVDRAINAEVLNHTALAEIAEQTITIP